MKTTAQSIVLSLSILCLTGLCLTGCSSNEPVNLAADATQEELDNYEKLIAEANAELSSDEESGQLGD